MVGLILAGSAAFKNDLAVSELFDPRLSAVVIKLLDVSYGGENGFNQAIELAADALSNVKFITEKKLLSAFFSEISQDTGVGCHAFVCSYVLCIHQSFGVWLRVSFDCCVGVFLEQGSIASASRTR